MSRSTSAAPASTASARTMSSLLILLAARSCDALLQPNPRPLAPSFKSVTALYSTMERERTAADAANYTHGDDDAVLTDVDARVLQAMMREDKLNLQEEQNMKKLLERGIRSKNKQRASEQAEPEPEAKKETKFSSAFFQKLGDDDNTLWKNIQRGAQDILSSAKIFVANRIERDAQLLGAIGLFAWERAVQDVGRALPAAANVIKTNQQDLLTTRPLDYILIIIAILVISVSLALVHRYRKNIKAKRKARDRRLQFQRLNSRLHVSTEHSGSSFDAQSPRREVDAGAWGPTKDRASSYDFFGVNHSSRNIMETQNMKNRLDSNSGDFISVRKLSDRIRERSSSLEFLYTDYFGSSTRRLLTSSQDNVENSGIGDSERSGDDPHPFFEDRALYDEFGMIVLSSPLYYYGPTRPEILYAAWTPPTPWKEASRHIFYHDVKVKLHRAFALQVTNDTLHIRQPGTDGHLNQSFGVSKLSTFVVQPPEGGILNVYEKGTSKNDWMEYTFESTDKAAQFQLDMIASQLFGPEINDMFQALRIVHEGSEAYDGAEYVLHDDSVRRVGQEGEDDDKRPTLQNPSHAGMAWDDAMRALSSIPSVRISLERLWLHRQSELAQEKGPVSPTTLSPHSGLGGIKQKSTLPVTEQSEIDAAQELISPEYLDKRLLLGPVDFFRLFVPFVENGAVPQDSSDKTRVEQMLRWRKRVARASVLTRAYTRSRLVINRGWELPVPRPATKKPLTKRLAYDDNDTNNERDFLMENEYYEATVSRDVLCHVRPDSSYLLDDNTGVHAKNGTVLSPYQAYSLVGAHIFETPLDKEGDIHPSCPLHPSRDPVSLIPSLHEIITTNPELDFLVYAVYPKFQKVAIVTCFVRSLPRGVDPKFDNVMQRFANGDVETRNRKVHFILQLGPYVGLSFASWAILRFLSFLLSLTKSGRDSPVSLEATKSRSPFPAMRLMHYAEVHHFGGSLRKDSTQPKNYVAMGIALDSKRVPNVIARFLFSRIEGGALSNNISDFTFVLEGDSDDELPERALSTLRFVHVDYKKVALPFPIHAARFVPEAKTENSPTRSPSIIQSIVSENLRRAVSVIGSPLRPSIKDQVENIAQPDDEDYDFDDAFSVDDSNTPLGVAADQLTEILSGTTIPVRACQLRNKRFHTTGRLDEEVNVEISIVVNREELKRFFVAETGNLKVAAVRIVETAAWRGMSFPIDTHACRIELQSGQFFQQGYDLIGNPVFYFRNMLLGPWRGDIDASISAILFRLDQFFSNTRETTKCTLVVLMGRPHGQRKLDAQADSTSKENEEEKVGDAGDADDESILSGNNHARQANESIANPRIDSEETWQNHTSKTMINRLVRTLEAHFPERLYLALVVPGKGPNPYFGSALAGQIAASTLFSSKTTRGKILFMKKKTDLQQFIPKESILRIVGGKVPIRQDVFQNETDA